MLALAGLAGCGGGSKPADSAGNCPQGTVLKGSDCLPADSAKSDDDSSSSVPKASKSDDAPPPSGGGGGSGTAGGGNSGGDTGTSGASGGQTPYDKDAVGVELKRAARQVKANCGAATDENGASGPWGKGTANLVLGRNGHVKQVTVPPDYTGKPVGTCIANTFQKIVFPPYAGSSDATLDVDLEVVKPKK
jgi:hypothetical protein